VSLLQKQRPHDRGQAVVVPPEEIVAEARGEIALHPAERLSGLLVVGCLELHPNLDAAR
jgi:hypothetical protein